MATTPETAVPAPAIPDFAAAPPLVRLPGVYPPQADTRLLASVVASAPPPAGSRVLDVCTGTGALALTAARLGAAEVTAVDISLRAVLSVRLNAFRLGLPVRVRRASFLQLGGSAEFDLVLANPPYVPTAAPAFDRRARAWDAGADGRALIDPLCALAPRLLSPSGTLLLVQSDVSGVDTTIARLRAGGLHAEEVARRRNPFGPVMHGRAAFLENAGLIERGRRHEDLVVIRAGRR